MFTRDDLDLLVAFAGQAAAAIENARLHKATTEQAESLRRIQAHQQSIIRSMSSVTRSTSCSANRPWYPVLPHAPQPTDR